MKRAIVIAALFMMFLSYTSMAHAFVETFSSGDAHWLAPTVNDAGTNTYPAATYQPSGGNTGGYITGTVSGSDTRLYGLQAPFKVADPALPPAQPAYDLYQDLSGKMLTVDYKKISGEVTGPTNMLVRFYIGMYSGGLKDYFVTTDAFAWNPNLASDWTTYGVIVTASNFQKWPNQSDGRTFDQVVASPEDIGLVFSDGFTNNQTLGFSGSAVIGIDNFGVTAVPIPGGLWLLGSGLMGLIGMRRARR